MAVQMWSLIAAYLLAASVERPMPGIRLVGLIGFTAGLVAVDAAQMIGDAQSSFSNSLLLGYTAPLFIGKDLTRNCPPEIFELRTLDNISRA